MRINREKLLQTMGIIALTLISLYYFNLLFAKQLDTLFYAINSIVLPFGIALFISYLLSPLMKLLETKARIKKRWINVVIVITVLLGFIALLSFVIGDIVYTQANEFIQNDLDQIIVSVGGYIENNEFLYGIYQNIVTVLEDSSSNTDLGGVIGIIQKIANVVVTIVLVPVFLVFILHDRDTIFTGLLSAIPEKNKDFIENLGKRANIVIEKYFNGKFLSMFILGLLFTIVLYIFGFSLDKAIFFGFTLGFLDIIPYVGGFIGIMLPVLFSFTIPEQLLFGEYAFIGLIVANIVLQFLQGNVIQPYIMGKEVNLHPLLVLSSFIFFGALFGVTGIILAIPLTGTIKTTLEYYKEVNDGKREG